jgi:hypothetical protein
VEPSVPLYYFHLCNGSDVLLDPEGRELGSLQQVQLATLSEARSVISHDALEGRVDLAYHIDVHDAAGGTVHSLQFCDAVVISPG